MLDSHWYSGDPTPVAFRLKDSLEATLHSTGKDVKYPSGYQEVEGFFADNVKINKLSHRAVKRWNLPLIRSWYRYGQIVPYGELQPGYLNPEPLENPVGSSGQLPSASGAGDIPDREIIRDWFLEWSNPSFKEIMEMDLFEFLKWDYKTFAPRKYRDMYLVNLHILELLDEMRNEGCLAEQAADYRAWLKEHTMDISYHLSTIDVFDDSVQQLVQSGLRTIQDALITLSERDNPTEEQILTLKNSRTYYHKNVWVWPAHVISLDRVEGPEDYVADFREAWEKNLQEIESTFPNHLEKFQNEIIEEDLSPGAKSYQRVSDSEMNAISVFGDGIVKG